MSGSRALAYSHAASAATAAFKFTQPTHILSPPRSAYGCTMDRSYVSSFQRGGVLPPLVVGRLGAAESQLQRRELPAPGSSVVGAKFRVEDMVALAETIGPGACWRQSGYRYAGVRYLKIQWHLIHYEWQWMSLRAADGGAGQGGAQAEHTRAYPQTSPLATGTCSSDVGSSS